MRRTAPSLLGLLLAGGCGTADVTGDYNVNTTNGANDCGFDNWTVGETATDIPITVRQTDGDVQLDVEGIVGGFLDLAAGSSVFNGTVGGNDIEASLIGENSAMEGGCNYTITIDLSASLDGDLLAGTLRYRPVTNMHPDCGPLEMCANVQTFNGLRPPTE